MLIMIKLEKEDIQTIQIGNNLAIKTDLLQIVFSPEAAQEFIQDVQQVQSLSQQVVPNSSPATQTSSTLPDQATTPTNPSPE